MKQTSCLGFQDEIEVMNSLAKPRKITLVGTDGKMYPFLGKPQDDLRKDARLMDFYAIINKLLQSNSESRRRRLCMSGSSLCPASRQSDLSLQTSEHMALLP